MSRSTGTRLERVDKIRERASSDIWGFIFGFRRWLLIPVCGIKISRNRFIKEQEYLNLYPVEQNDEWLLFSGNSKTRGIIAHTDNSDGGSVDYILVDCLRDRCRSLIAPVFILTILVLDVPMHSGLSDVSVFLFSALVLYLMGSLLIWDGLKSNFGPSLQKSPRRCLPEKSSSGGFMQCAAEWYAWTSFSPSASVSKTTFPAIAPEITHDQLQLILQKMLLDLKSDLSYHGSLAQIVRETLDTYDQEAVDDAIRKVLHKLLSSGVEIGETAKVENTDYTIGFIAWRGTVEERIERALHEVEKYRDDPIDKTFAFWLCLHEDVDEYEPE